MTSYQLDRPAPARLGRYELLGHLATGGMAEIHLARLAGEAGYDKVVVVKRLLPELVASQTFVAMFLDEGKLVARLDHPNVCEVHELGNDGSEYFLAMPYLDGVSVHQLISRPREADRAAELRVCASIIVQSCAGLHHAHELRDADGSEAGLVHRDVSPSNLFATSKGVVKVLDFGVAKVRGASETEAGTIKGKQQYMAPEQLLGETLDRRCDVFALGIVMFELATHQRLFKRASDYLTARAILEEPIPRADTIDPAIPGDVADVIAKALARDKNERYADAAELARAVEATFAAHGGLASASEIAAVVMSTDELTAQRTRQEKVIGNARKPASSTASSATTNIVDAKTNLRAKPPTDGPVTGRNEHAPDKTTLTRAPLATQTTRSPWPMIVLGATVLLTSTYVGYRLMRAPPAAEPLRAPTVVVESPSTLPPPPQATAVERVDAPLIEMPADPVRTAPVAKKAGTISIDSSPFATIFVDGKRIDVTPLLNHSLPAGRHQVRAVLGDGRSKELTVDIPAGKAAKPLVLRW